MNKLKPVLLLALLLGCQGRIGDTIDAPAPQEPRPEPPSIAPEPLDPAALYRPSAFGAAGLRRLNNAELRSSLLELYGVDPIALMDALPQDGSTASPFDNDYRAQSVSVNLIQGLNTFAEAYAAMVTATPGSISSRAGCTPSGPGDAACFESVVRTLGRRALRRPLGGAEVTAFGGLLQFSVEEGRFEAGVELVIAAFLQHPEALYRVELGRPSADPGLLELDNFEIAARIAFLVWGSAPDAELLDAAEASRLTDPAERRAQAERLFATPVAQRHWERFHAMWLGYDGVSLPDDRRADLLDETHRLIEKLIFEDDSRWLDLFTHSRTFVTPSLASHYGLDAPVAPGWVESGPDRGGGILSHGLFLAQGGKFGDTSPTLRGARMMQRVMCQDLGMPPPDVDTDNPPPGAPSACKPERYFMRNESRCASCHAFTDNLGFGLENLGASGEWRGSEPGRPDCAIDGRGQALGRPFQGVAELGAILAGAKQVEACATKQLFRFAVGRVEEPVDRPTLDALQGQLASTPGLKALVLAMVESPAIAHRRR